jgi:hypothetical protein
MSIIKKTFVRVGVALSCSMLGVTSAFAQVATTTPGAPTTSLGGDWVLNILYLMVGVSLMFTGIWMAVDRKQDKKHIFRA